jgi:ABC-type uncharacterized transport system ATPase subunit
MSGLHLDSLDIDNFRCFQHLRITRLGRVNLIVGRNSVGKTCLLEALAVYANNADPVILQGQLAARNEFVYSGEDLRDLEQSERLFEQYVLAFGGFFHGRDSRPGESIASISTVDGLKKVTFGLNFFAAERDEQGQLRSYRVLPKDEYDLADDVRIRLSVRRNAGRHQSRALFAHLKPGQFLTRAEDDINCLFIPSSGFNNSYMAELWDRIALTDLEQITIKALRSIDSNISRYSFLKAPPNRYPIVKHAFYSAPIPLRILGHGMIRTLGISLALVNAKNGILLIDEFESGLHHTVQTDLWRLIIQFANQLDIQVFATTHSWDCVEAFQQASAEDQTEQSLLIRLEKRRDAAGIEAVLYDKRRMEIATREGIEVR